MGKHHALAREAILAALTAYTGITTADGATPANNTLICSDLIRKNDFITGKTIVIGSGDGDREDSGASSFVPATGTITVVTPFSAQIKKGTIFRVLNISTVEIDVESIKVQTDKLAGEAVTEGTQSKLWNTAEQDLVSLGAAATKKKLHSLIVDISGLTATATITIRLYMKVNGNEKKLYEQTFTVGTDPDGCWIVNGTIGIHDVLRVTCQSNNALDDGKAIAYTYMLEAQ